MKLRVLVRLQRFHPWFHRNRPVACWYCRAVWHYLLRDPGFQESIDAGMADIEAGRLVGWDEYKHR